MNKREKTKPVTLGLIQARAAQNVSANMERTRARIYEAAEQGAQIVCLMELYRTPYFPQDEKGESAPLAETVPGESTDTFSQMARELGIVIIVPIYERASNGKCYNSVVVIDDKGTLLPTYRKMHLPQDPLFYEQIYFTPGDLGFRIYSTRFASFSVLICYDQWFPEAARTAALQGAELLFYPTAIGWIKDEPPAEEDWLDAWETIQRSHAIANGVHVAAVNRVGDEGRLRFWGHSFVCDAFGRVLGTAGPDREEVLVVTVDLAMNQKIQEGWGFLRNRRPETYGELTLSRDRARIEKIKNPMPRQRTPGGNGDT